MMKRSILIGSLSGPDKLRCFLLETNHFVFYLFRWCCCFLYSEKTRQDSITIRNLRAELQQKEQVTNDMVSFCFNCSIAFLYSCESDTHRRV